MTQKIKEIWKEVYNILENARNGGSLSYIKNIIEGVREDIVDYPVIILEPDNEVESVITTPYNVNCVFNIMITCWFEVINKDIQIIDRSEREKGILDIVVDIKNELCKYPNLNGKCQKFSFSNTRFIFENYPFRGVEITMAIEYITHSTQR